MTSPTNERVIDLLDGQFYVDDPYSTYAWMRDHAPVYWDPINEFWGISRYDDIVFVEKHNELFINSDPEHGYRPNLGADPSIIGLDDPLHSARRNLVSRRFTPRAAGQWEDHVRDVVTNLIDGALAKGTADVVEDLAAPLPAMMIGLLLGFPDDMWPNLRDWSARTIALGGGPRYLEDDGIAAAMEFAGACAELYEHKKTEPGDDVMSKWVRVDTVGGCPFSLNEVISDCLLILDGGAETTRTVIARTLLELARRPDQVAKLKAGASITTAVDEFIRFVSPVHNMCRCAVQDVELNGQLIKKGQQLVLMYGSANRDPLHFERPDELDVTRSPNHHIAFGFGTHFCLGASLARLEIRVFFEEFLRRVADWSVVEGSIEEMPNAFVFGLRHADVRLTQA